MAFDEFHQRIDISRICDANVFNELYRVYSIGFGFAMILKEREKTDEMREVE